MSDFSILAHKIEMTVPLFMVEHTLREGGKRINMLRAYLYISARSNGCVILTPARKRQIGEELGMSTRNVRRLLDKLQERNWINKDGRTGRTYVRGFREIRKRENEFSRQGFVLDARTDLQEEEHFKALICGAYINNLGRYKVHDAIRKNRRGRGKEWLKGRSVPTSQPRRLFWWPVAADYIAKILSISISTAHEYRKLAEQYGFIEIRRHRREVTPEQLGKWEAEENQEWLKRIRTQRQRLLIDGIHWVRSTVIRYRRIPRTKKAPRKSARLLSHAMSNQETGFSESFSSLSSPIPY